MTSYQPGEPPSYTAPQDPWSAAPGVATPPTDPIPQPPRGQFAPGVASPVAPPPSNVWAQETIAHDDRRPPGRTGLYVLVTVLVLVLGGAGGYGAWYLITQRICAAGSANCNPQSQQTQQQTQSTQSTDPVFDPAIVKVGDCLVNHGTPEDPKMRVESCNTPGAFRVLYIKKGKDIPENANGEFDRQTTGPAVCGDVPDWDNSWFGWDDPDNDNRDYFFCLDNLASP
jgi:hypothetical protein